MSNITKPSNRQVVHDSNQPNDPECSLPGGVSYPFPKDFLCDGVMYENITINGNKEWRVTESAAKQFQQWQKHQTRIGKCSPSNEPKTQNYYQVDVA